MVGEPFPAVLRWSLFGALGAFVLAFVLPLVIGDSGAAGNFAQGTFVLLLGVSALLALFAVPVAVFLLVRGGLYVSVGNVVMTLLALLPIVLVAAVVLTFKFGHFHI